jgi:hypothetical protein
MPRKKAKRDATRKPKTPRRKPRIRQITGKRDARGGKRSTSFKPGQSGNLAGRTPLPADYKVAMADRLGPKGLACLEAILDTPDHPRHEQAVEYTINRWKGTPTVRTELTGPAGGPLAIKTVLTSDEKRTRVAELLETARARVAGGRTGEDDPHSD